MESYQGIIENIILLNANPYTLYDFFKAKQFSATSGESQSFNQTSCTTVYKSVNCFTTMFVSNTFWQGSFIYITWGRFNILIPNLLIWRYWMAHGFLIYQGDRAMHCSHNTIAITMYHWITTLMWCSLSVPTCLLLWHYMFPATRNEYVGWSQLKHIALFKIHFVVWLVFAFSVGLTTSTVPPCWSGYLRKTLKSFRLIWGRTFTQPVDLTQLFIKSKSYPLVPFMLSSASFTAVVYSLYSSLIFTGTLPVAIFSETPSIIKACWLLTR